MVIVAYRPKPGQDARLLELLKEHVPILRGIGLATARPVQLMRAKDGTYVEVFEWVSAQAVEQAHSHPTVLEMWAGYASACDYVPLASLAESAEMFASFVPVEIQA